MNYVFIVVRDGAVEEIYAKDKDVNIVLIDFVSAKGDLEKEADIECTYSEVMEWGPHLMYSKY